MSEVDNTTGEIAAEEVVVTQGTHGNHHLLVTARTTLDGDFIVTRIDRPASEAELTINRNLGFQELFIGGRMGRSPVMRKALLAMGISQVRSTHEGISTTEYNLASAEKIDSARRQIYDGTAIVNQPLFMQSYSPGGEIPVENLNAASAARHWLVSSTDNAAQAFHDRANHSSLVFMPPDFLEEIMEPIAEFNIKHGYELVTPEERKRVGLGLDGIQSLHLLFKRESKSDVGYYLGLVQDSIFDPNIALDEILDEGYSDRIVEIFDDAETRITDFAELAEAA